MNRLIFTIAAVIVALAAACAGSAPAPTATTSSPPPAATTASPAPTATTPSPAPTSTAVPQVPTATPMVTQEWELHGIAIDGDTVTVSLRVFAGIDVGVTVAGAAPNRVDASIPILAFVFENVAAGEHPVEISDVVGHQQSASVTVEASDTDDETLPRWLAEWLVDLDSGKVEFEPRSITRYRYQGETVYYVVQQCCDQFSDLLDADGNLIGHPDGGITGRGDGVTLFSPSGLIGEDIWQRR